MAEANIISLPDSINEDRLKELINQKNILLSSLEKNSQDLQQAQAIVVDQDDKYRFYEKKIQDLTEKRKLLLTSLESNWRDLQQTQALDASQLHGMNVGNIVKKLIKERETLVTEIEENLKNLQEVENVVTSHLITDRFIDNCFGSNSDFFERKSEVTGKQPLNSRTLQLECILSALLLDQDRSFEIFAVVSTERKNPASKSSISSAMCSKCRQIHCTCRANLRQRNHITYSSIDAKQSCIQYTFLLFYTSSLSTRRESSEGIRN
ncbi:uncharacterized protein [Apteryx mantelli]|uniref:Uncharacterized protein isoform X1 n=2 Tax=Apteryx mantelli TaxID=2696672 RepID=A0ABM4E7C4_9AVES